MNSPVDLARKLTKIYNLNGNFDIDYFVFLLGGEIIYSNSFPVDALIRKNGSSFNIIVDSSKPITRQRFSIAHEIGHLFLHLYYDNKDIWNNIDDADSIKFRNGSSIEEREANQFAAEFLMPEFEFREIAHLNLSNNQFYLNPISEHFGTSIDAVRYRGVNLGIWN